MQYHKLAIYRLTALWAFVECGLGGILHAAKLPVTGFVIGAFAIVILTMMATIIKRSDLSIREHLLPAVMVVILVKAMVTPHAGIGAYLAVGFQGLIAFLLYSTGLPLRISAVLLGIFSMVESALQKVLVLSLIYGNSIWEAIEGLATWLSQQFGLSETVLTSFELVSGYTGIYALWGSIVGWGSVTLARQIVQEEDISAYQIDILKASDPESRKRRKRWKLVVVVLILVGICTFFLLSDRSNSILYLIARVILVLILVFKVIGPLATNLLHRFLKGKQTEYKDRLAGVLDLLPYMRQIIKISWKDASDFRGTRRIWHSTKRTLLITLYHNPIGEKRNLEK